jgi:hypothetical protein
MQCEVCKKGMKEGVTLYRINRKGIPGIWRCWNDMDLIQRQVQINNGNREITKIINPNGDPL